MGVDSVDIGMADWAYDYCDLIFDKLDRQQMIEAGSTEDEAIFGRPGRYAWTKTHCQFMYRFGGSEPADEFVYYKYEEQTNNIFHYRFTFDEAEDMLGDFGVELVIDESEPDVRTMEWFFPWDVVTNGGMNIPEVHDDIGIIFGYNDNDGEPLTTCHLRFYKGEGHWVRTFNIDQATGDTLDTVLHYACYQNLMFAHGMPPEDIEPVINPLSKNLTAAQPILKEEYFTLKGERLAAVENKLRIPDNSIVIRKITFANKETVSDRVMIHDGSVAEKIK
jgi:hypothetical protein